MKKPLLFLLVLAGMAMANSAMAQTCTIHLFSKGWQTKVYMNDQLVTGLNKDEALEYTVPANGRAAISIKFNEGAAAEVTVDTEKDSDVYIIAYRMVYPIVASKTKIVDLKEWNKESKNFKDLVQMEAK